MIRVPFWETLDGYSVQGQPAGSVPFTVQLYANVNIMKAPHLWMSMINYSLWKNTISFNDVWIYN